MLVQEHLKKKPSKINKSYLLFLATSIISTLSIPVHANPEDLAQTIYFESDTLSYNNETKLGIYQGHIKLTQGNGVLTAEYATSYSDQNGPNRPKLIATGNTIYYYPQKDWLEAVGNAEIVQGQNHVKGPQINYDFKKKTVGSPISKEGHTQILIAPLQPVRS
jgi:lipopolysaccharide export system protein LptA